MFVRPYVSVSVIISCFAIVAGCDQPDGYAALDLVEVTGTVTLDDQPLSGARVLFESAAGAGAGAEGFSDAEGKYRLMYDSEHPGCPPGSYVVRITSSGTEEGADPEGGSGEEGTVAAETIPAIYNAQSTLKADVSSSEREFSFALKSK